ncbi:MAG: ABC transporter permease [Cyanobacteria bacterium REEB65]|nr:ABC transporter permease [Cyanobacteria bacterium REEB65]
MPTNSRPVDELPPPVSTATRIWRRFRRHKMAVAALWILGIMYFVMVFAEFFAPYSMTAEDRNRAFQPPAAIHLRDTQGHWQMPFIYDWKDNLDFSNLFSGTGSNVAVVETGGWQQDTSKAYPLHLFVHGDPYKLFGVIPADVHLVGVTDPHVRFYLLGGDPNGRDLFSRLFFGARVSLTVGIVALAIVIPVGTVIGGIAGYFGGWVDTSLMWLVESVLAFPTFYLLLALFGATYKWSLSSAERFFLITILLSFLGWAGLARVIRGMVLSLKEQEYVEASRAAGARHLWIIVKHLLPQTASWVVISVSLSIPGYIYMESFLSLLGLGVQPPDASWGNMLQPALNVSDLLMHPWMLAPGVAIVITTVAWNFLGDGLRDAFDSKQRI